MVDLGTIGSKIVLDDSQYMATLGKVEKSTQSTAGNIQSTFMKVAGGAAMLSMLKKVKDEYAEFSIELANINSIASELDMSTIKDGLLDMNNLLGMAKKNAFALYHAYSSGIQGTTEELVKFTEIAATTAKTIRSDVENTTITMTTLMNAYNLSVKDAAEVSDMFYMIVKRGKTTGEELAGSLGLVVNTASMAGVSLDELGSSLATLTRTMPTSRATVSLAQMLQAFIKPSKEATRTAKEFGIEMSATAIRTKGLAGMIKELKDKVGDNPEVLGKLFGNVRAFRAVAALVGKSFGDFERITEEFKNKGGSALEAFEAQSKSFGAKWTAMTVGVNKSVIKLGETLEPVFSALVSMVNGLTKTIDGASGVEMFLTALSIGVLTVGKGIQSTVAMTGMASKSIAQMTGSTAGLAESMLIVVNELRLMNRQLLINNAMLKRTGASSAIAAKGYIDLGVATGIATTSSNGLEKQTYKTTASMKAMTVLNWGVMSAAVAVVGYQFGKWLYNITEVKGVMDDIIENVYKVGRNGETVNEIQKGNIKQNNKLLKQQGAIQEKNMNKLRSDWGKFKIELSDIQTEIGAVKNTKSNENYGNEEYLNSLRKKYKLTKESFDKIEALRKMYTGTVDDSSNEKKIAKWAKDTHNFINKVRDYYKDLGSEVKTTDFLGDIGKKFFDSLVIDDANLENASIINSRKFQKFFETEYKKINAEDMYYSSRTKPFDLQKIIEDDPNYQKMLSSTIEKYKIYLKSSSDAQAEFSSKLQDIIKNINNYDVSDEMFKNTGGNQKYYFESMVNNSKVAIEELKTLYKENYKNYLDSEKLGNEEASKLFAERSKDIQKEIDKRKEKIKEYEEYKKNLQEKYEKAKQKRQDKIDDLTERRNTMRNDLLQKTLGSSSVNYSSTKSYDKAKKLVGDKSKAFMDKKYKEYIGAGYTKGQARASAISATKTVLEDKEKTQNAKASLGELKKIRKELEKTKSVKLKIGD